MASTGAIFILDLEGLEGGEVIVGVHSLDSDIISFDRFVVALGVGLGIETEAGFLLPRILKIFFQSMLYLVCNRSKTPR